MSLTGKWKIKSLATFDPEVGFKKLTVDEILAMPEGEDKEIEDLVEIWEDGDFPAFYMSLFWQDPPIVEIPEEYR